MFSKHIEHVLADLSTDLRDEQDWKIGTLRILEFPLNITSLAVEPVTGLLAAGTSSGAIYVFGSPGVESKLTLPQSVGIRFVHFAPSTYNIVCLDNDNNLHIWDLLEFGRPKLVASAHFDDTNSITLCPSHAHVFLAMRNGDVKTYDLACLRKSKYSMPNMWKLYEEMIATTGAPSFASPNPLTTVETVIHPRNLNLLFVAYAGGVILTDLTERSTLRAYELVLLPGAPGGAGYGEDILTHRRLTVACLAIHPSGHLLAVGYTDGSIAFWAVEDDDQPLLVRTLDSNNVNHVDSHSLEAHLESKEKNKVQQLIREPIFKLSWSSFSNSSDPRGGDTTLTILGGLDTTKPPGLTVLLFPPFNPTEPPSTPPLPQNETLHPLFRSSMIESLNPLKSFFYESIGVVQDYLLIPRSSPHLAGNFDPYAILLLTESTRNARTVQAYQYPPPGFIKTTSSLPKTEIAEIEEDMEELSTTNLQSPPPPTPPEKSPRHINYTPSSMRIPFILSSAGSGILGGHLFKLENDVYQAFVDDDVNDLHLTLNGGRAYADPDLKLSKYQPRRALVTYNQDLSVQFFDMSAQLLIPTADATPLDQEFPKPLPGLTIQLDDLLDDSSIVEILKPHIGTLTIQSVHVAPEALECAVALTSGDIVVYHSSMGLLPSKIIADIEIILLDHIRSTPRRRLEPYFMLTPNKGPITTCAISDTGFLAVSYTDGSLIVVDMRGPKIILSHGSNKKTKHKLQPSIHVHAHGGDGGPSSPNSTPDIAKSLTWTISQLDKDHQLSMRLIVAYQSGHAEIYTLVHSGNPVSWSIIDEPVPCKAMADPLPGGTFVVDTKGVPVRADRSRLAASFQGVPPAGTPQCLMITVGAKGARCNFNIDGERLAKIEWGAKVGLVKSAQIVENMRSRTLVVQTDRHDMLVYSIPHLQYLHTVQLPPVSSLPLTIDASGDFIAWTVHPVSKLINSATYGTFFDIRRANTLPDVDFATTRGTIPAQPQPVSLGPASFLGSWFSFNQTKSGEQIDELLGGPDRPVLEKRPDRVAGGTSEGVAGTTSAASNLAASAAAVQSSIYNKLSSAMNERGQMLGDLEQRFNSLGDGSRSLAAQAKRLAAQQTAKGWFGF